MEKNVIINMIIEAKYTLDLDDALSGLSYCDFLDRISVNRDRPQINKKK